MLEETGDLWRLDGDARCILVNGDINGAGNLVMGAGVAKQAARKYPILPNLWGRCFALEFGVHVTELVDSGDTLIAFPTKHHWRDNSPPGLVLESAVQLMQQLDRFPQLQRVLLPRPGCGLGGLDWEGCVKPLISSVLDDRVVVITFA